MSRQTIGVVARAAGVGVDTVRYYEREGLLGKVGRSGSGYRLYGAADIERLQFIRKAKLLGFTLDDIAELLRLQDGSHERAAVRARARTRINDLDRRIVTLTAIRDALVALENRCQGRGPVAGCPIIQGVQAVSLEPLKEC